MTTNHHTAISLGAAADAATFNTPLEALDSAITNAGQPSFSVHKNGSDQTIGDSADVLLTWSTENWDSDADFASNKFTPQVAGKYMLIIGLYFTGILADQAVMQAIVYKNGAREKRAFTRSSSTGGQGVSLTCLVDANGSSDYFEAYAYHEFGGDELALGSDEITFFQGHRIY